MPQEWAQNSLIGMEAQNLDLRMFSLGKHYCIRQPEVSTLYIAKKGGNLE